MARQIKLGASIRGTGYNVSAWRHPSVDPAAGQKIDHYIRLAKIAEEACFDMVFFADALAIRAYDDPPGSADRYDGDTELDPSQILPAMAVLTRHVGLISTASTSYNEPYHIARRYGTLDHMSNGRAGWNAVTSTAHREAQNFSRQEHWGKDERYERAAEFIEIVIGLWASWDKDALVHDKASGIFSDRSKVHDLNFVGKYFQVRGPLTSTRSPQGRPLLIQAGASDHGLDLAGRFADVVYSVPRSMEIAIRNRKELRARAEKFGRDPDDVLAMPGIQIITGRTRKEAEEKYRVLAEIVDPLPALGMISRQFGNFISPEMLDGPIPPDPGYAAGAYSVSAESIRIARENNWTVRQLCQKVGMGQHSLFLGTPDEVVDLMATWFEGGAADGFNFLPTHLPESLADVAEHIVPRLQERGLFRKSYEGSTLRENLGLRPV